MSDRTVRVTLTAQVSGYLAGMQKAAQATRQTGSEADKLAAKKDAFQSVGRSLLAIGTVAAAASALAVKSFADFDAKMSQVKTLSHATASEMDDLSTAALNMGQKIGFSATQVADAEIELVKAGVSVSDIMSGALKGSLDLAAAGQIEVGKATEIATIALTQFGLQGKDIPHVADLLSAGADKALGGVTDLGEALKSGGLVANQFGLSIEETIGTLSAFANAGLIGETAGTDLRQMLLKLGNPAADATATMKQLGISIYDSSGQFVGMSNLAGQLADKMGKLDPATRNAALATIFGSRAIAGANALYNEGAKGIQGWVDKVNDSGFAAQQAKGKMDNLQGDLKKLGAAFQTDLIKTGSTANGVLRGVTQTVTNLVEQFGELPKPAQGAVLAVGALVAVAALAAGGFLTLIPKINATRTALSELNISLKGLSLAGGAVALVITGIVTVLSLVANAQAQAKARTDEFTDALGDNSNAITKNVRAVAAKQLHDNGAIEIANKLGVSLKTVTDAALGNTNAMAKIAAAQEKAGRAAESTGDQYANFGSAMGGASSKASDSAGLWNDLSNKIGITSGNLKDAQRNAANTAKAMDGNTTSVEAASDAYQSSASEVDDLNNQLSQLIDTVNKANGVGQDAVTANADYQDSLAKVQDTIDKAKDGTDGYSTSLDEATAAGSANAEMFANSAAKAQAAAEAQFKLDGNTQNYTASLQAAHDKLYAQILDLTGNADAAQALTDKIFAMPSQKEIQFISNANDEAAAAQRYRDVLNSIPDQKIVNIITRGTNGADQYGGTEHPGFASGGLVDYYANGGVERHVAQFAPAGAMRVWAEPETGGEAYIPLAASKRTRSLQIWQATGKRLGVQGFADGGLQYASAPPSSVIVQAPARAGSERPITMDGKLFGMLREMANGEAHIVVSDYAHQSSQEARRGFGGW